MAEPPSRWLLYTDAGPADTIADALHGWLSATSATVVQVRPGDRLAEDATGWTIRPGDVHDTRAMLDALRQRDQLPDRVVHLWTLAERTPERDDIADVDDVVRLGLNTLVAVAQAAGELGVEALSLDIVTAASQQVLGMTSVVPARATLLGACRLIPVEYPKAAVRLVDLEHGAVTDADLAALRAELSAEPADRLVGLRSGRRWVPGYDVLHMTENSPDAGPIRRGGTYLVTGGLGGVGLALAQRLAEQFKARLVLFGRTPVPPREQWDAIRNRDTTPEEVRRRLTGLCDLEASGAEVAVVAGDVGNPQDVRRAVAVAVDRFGGLNGVLHAAGVPGIGLIQFKTGADIERVLRPKVAGTVALATALRGMPLDFVVLFSSITSALGGGAGQLDYCAANAFLDAYAQAGGPSEPRTVAVNWGEWTWNGWKEGLEGYDPVLREFFEDNRRRFGISFDEGWRALLKVLDSGERQVVVSTQDFQAMVDVSTRYTVEDLQSASAQRRTDGGGHPRPDLATPFVAPQTDAERAIADIWATALGLAEVGIADNFFELGGNSLIGVDIIARVRRALKLDQLPPHILYETPTVGALAAAATSGDDGQPDGNTSHALERQRRIEMRRTSLRRGASA
jgi:NAD(P)-dependent dehydrogenase (short-subunit alcohol dehydrogenase family)